MAENRGKFTRLNRRMTDEFQIDNPAPMTVLAPELVPVAEVESSRPELEYLNGVIRYTANMPVAAVVGEYTYAELYLPADTSVLAVITDVWVTENTGGARMDYGPASATLLASLTQQGARARDFRIADNAIGRTSAAIPAVGTDALNTLLTARGSVFTTQNIMAHIQPGWVLMPGYGFAIANLNNQNRQHTYCIWWYERPMQLGESQ